MNIELELTDAAFAHITKIRGARAANIHGDKVISLVKHMGVFKGSSVQEHAILSGPGIGVGLDELSEHHEVICLRGYRFVLVGDWPSKVILDFDGKSLVNVA